jgi:hypothetical protein
MPSTQRGQVYRLGGGSWAYRYRDEHKRRRQKGGFATRSEVLEALDDALKTAGNPERSRRREWTVVDLVDRYMAQHQASPATIARLNAMLKKVIAAFGDVRLNELLPDEIGAWAKRLPEGHRHDAMVAFRQVLNAAVRWKLIEENPARLVRNPLPGRAEIRPFESWEEIEAVAEELGRGARSSSSQPGLVCGPRSGSRSHAATSTAPAVPSPCGGRSRAASWASTGRHLVHRGAYRSVSAFSTPSTRFRRG